MNSKHQKTDLRPSLLFTALAIAGLVSPLPSMAALKPLVSVNRPGHVTAHASMVRRPVTKASRPADMKTQAVNGILVHMRNNTRLTPAVLASFERATATRLAVSGNPGNGQYVLHPASATSPAKLAAATTKLRKNPNVLAANLYVKDKPRLIQARHGQKVTLAANSVPSGHSHVWQQSLGVPVQLNGSGSPDANFQAPQNMNSGTANGPMGFDLQGLLQEIMSLIGGGLGMGGNPGGSSPGALGGGGLGGGALGGLLGGGLGGGGLGGGLGGLFGAGPTGGGNSPGDTTGGWPGAGYGGNGNGNGNGNYSSYNGNGNGNGNYSSYNGNGNGNGNYGGYAGNGNGNYGGYGGNGNGNYGGYGGNGNGNGNYGSFGGNGNNGYGGNGLGNMMGGGLGGMGNMMGGLGGGGLGGGGLGGGGLGGGGLGGMGNMMGGQGGGLGGLGSMMGGLGGGGLGGMGNMMGGLGGGGMGGMGIMSGACQFFCVSGATVKSHSV